MSFKRLRASGPATGSPWTSHCLTEGQGLWQNTTGVGWIFIQGLVLFHGAEGGRQAVKASNKAARNGLCSHQLTPEVSLLVPIQPILGWTLFAAMRIFTWVKRAQSSPQALEGIKLLDQTAG